MFSLIFSPFHPALMFLFTPTFVIRVLPCVLRTVCAFHWRCIYHSYPSFSPLQGSVPHLNIKATVDNGETLESTKNLQPASRAKEEEQGSDSGKEHLPQPNKATVRGGSPHSHRDTHTNIHMYTQRPPGEYTPGDGSRRGCRKEKTYSHLLW